jgi:Tfp pilus assembly protein PilV
MFMRMLVMIEVMIIMLIMMITVMMMAMLINLSPNTQIAQHHHCSEQKLTEDFTLDNIHHIIA